MQKVYLTVALAALSSARAVANQEITCHELYIPVAAETTNSDVSNSSSNAASISPFDSKAISDSAPVASSGNFTIYGRYCRPGNDVKNRRNALQVLVHGATYTVDYWSGLAPPGTKSGQNEYSWIVYASGQGYPTLSLDRLCNGKSSRPNGTQTCREPLESEVIHKIIKKARSGTLPGIKEKFFKIIYVGHSYGSVVGNSITTRHPNDIDAFIATGFALNLAQSSTSAADPNYQPAQDVQPKKWGFLMDPSYFIATSKKGTRDLFYFGSYKKSEAHYDYMHRQTVTRGELESVELGQKHAPDFKGSVFVLNGNDDNAFCGILKNERFTNHGNCSDGISSGVKKGYPNARAFEYYNTANTGHCLNLHTTAQESYKAAHDFLSRQGF